MRDTMTRFMQTLRADRQAFAWMDFDDRATGDALILIAVTRVLLLLALGNSLRVLLNVGFFTVAVQFLLQGLIFWLIYTGVVWAITKFLFQEHTDFAFMLRLTGFAYPTFILAIAIAVFFGAASSSAFLAASSIAAIWFVYIVARGVDYAADVGMVKAATAAVGGYAGYLIVNAILSGLPI